MAIDFERAVDQHTAERERRLVERLHRGKANFDIRNNPEAHWNSRR